MANSLLQRTLAALLAALAASAAAAPPGPAQAAGQGVGAYIDDSVITTKLKAAMLDAPPLNVAEIHVDTVNGVVCLSGFVDNADAIAKADALAHKVAGVKSVRNDIHLR